MFQNPTIHSHGKIIDIVVILIVVNILGLLAGLYSTLGQKLLLDFFPGIANEQLVYLFLASLAQAVLFIGFPVLLVLYKYQGTIREVGLIWDSWRSNLTLGFFGGIGLFALVVGVGLVIDFFVPVDPEPQPFALLIMSASEPKQLILPFIMGSVLAPVGEEFFFRGFVYPIFRRKVGIKMAIILSGIIFASLHFDLIRMIPLAVGGMGLAWLYERSGSLVTPIVAHSVWNTIMTLLILVAGIT